MRKMNFSIAGFLAVVILSSQTAWAQNVRYPDSFIIESVLFSPSVLKSGDIVKATARIHLLERRPDNCPYVKCWGHMVWPSGGSSYLGQQSCEIREIDPLNIEIVLKNQILNSYERGFYQFQGLSLKSSCHDYAFYYDGPHSHFKVID